MKKLVFAMSALGWFLLMLALIFGAVRDVGLDAQLYYDLQMKAGILDEAGISDADLMRLDVSLARYLGRKQDDLDIRLMVFGQEQSAFNEKELHHMRDCKRLFAPLVNPWLNIAMAVAGVALALYGEHRGGISKKSYACSIWMGSVLILLPLGLLAAWAAVDFSSAFTFFHELLFTNNLWLLDPRTDLLIRICPSSMFAGMGLRIALRAAAVLLGIPGFLTVLLKLSLRKRKQNENAEL